MINLKKIQYKCAKIVKLTVNELKEVLQVHKSFKDLFKLD